MTNNTRRVSICAVPHDMTIVEGGVMFSDKSGFWGVTGRFMFEYRAGLWYLVTSEDTFGNVACCHITKMHKLLTTMVKPEHQANGPLEWLAAKAMEGLDE